MPATYSIERSTVIAAPPDAVYEQVADFHHWQDWSPWEELDPDLQRSYSGADSGTGARYAWRGNRKAGVGRMEIVEATEPSLVRIDLRFEKPFKSESQTSFELVRDGDDTRVTWSMMGTNNLLLRVFTLIKSMDSLIGPDFEKGLAKLKRVVEGTSSA